MKYIDYIFNLLQLPTVLTRGIVIVGNKWANFTMGPNGENQHFVGKGRKSG